MAEGAEPLKVAAPVDGVAFESESGLVFFEAFDLVGLPGLEKCVGDLLDFFVGVPLWVLVGVPLLVSPGGMIGVLVGVVLLAMVG